MAYTLRLPAPDLVDDVGETLNGPEAIPHGVAEATAPCLLMISQQSPIYRLKSLLFATRMIASRLAFDCTPRGQLFGLPVNGTRVRFELNVFYGFRQGKIRTVLSVIDKSSVTAQI